jgi:hypothetical protein
VTLEEMRQQIETALGGLTAQIPELQVTGYYNTNPSPPSLDLYPGDPSQDGAGFGLGSQETYWTVRARVNVADDLAAQQVLIELLEPATGVASALADANVSVREFSGYREYPDMVDGRVLGCEWLVRGFL